MSYIFIDRLTPNQEAGEESHPDPEGLRIFSAIAENMGTEVDAEISEDGKSALLSVRTFDDDGVLDGDDVARQDHCHHSSEHYRDLSVFFHELADRMDEKAEAHHESLKPKPIPHTELEIGERFVFVGESVRDHQTPDEVFTKVRSGTTNLRPAEGWEFFMDSDGWIFNFKETGDLVLREADAEWLDECW